MADAPERGVPSELLYLRAQVDVYARELQQAFAAEREAERQVEAARRQLETFAGDLRKLLDDSLDERERLEHGHCGVILRIARVAAVRAGGDPQSCDRSAACAATLARELGLPGSEVRHLAFATAVRDIGLIELPEAIAPGREDAALGALREHPERGARLLGGTDVAHLETARAAALTHHECYDGSGFPLGLRGDAIPLAGRLARIVDAYELLRLAPRDAESEHERARRGLLEGAPGVRPGHFDPALLELFATRHDALAAAFDGASRPAG